MKFRSIALLAVITLIAAFALGQSVPVQVTLSSSITALNQQTVYVSSVSSFPTVGSGFANSGANGVSTEDYLYVDRELMRITAINTTNNSVTVKRAQGGTKSALHGTTALVLEGQPQVFQTADPTGSCTYAATAAEPTINVLTGNQWLCSTVSSTWVAGFVNQYENLAPTTAVASAAGLVTPSGPLFHMTGTAAITGLNLPVGFNQGTICAIPDGAWTTTTANNIANASTAVANKPLCWTYDVNTAKFYPSY